MRIGIFGMGYVGTVSAACLAEKGHDVIGVDTNATKVRFINDGISPIIEPGLNTLIEDSVSAKRLRATGDPKEVVQTTDMSIVCVGTPSQRNGALNLEYVRQVCEQIGSSLADHTGFHTVVIRSTLLPGSICSVVQPALEQSSGKRAGSDFGLCFNPEFLREGSAISDYWNPPKTVIGASDARTGEIVASLYQGLAAPLFLVEMEVAEMVKYVDNLWHALKVSFANEIGSFSKTLGIDSHKVMDVFCADTKLNISSHYLKPGFAFGGSCLPKDVRALSYAARLSDVKLPIVEAILESNRTHIERGLELVFAAGSKKVGVLGLSFKPGTDDVRESPIVTVIETLIGKGFDVRVYDHNVATSSLTGANREYIDVHIPHIEQLMVSTIDAILDHSDVIVVGNAAEEFEAVMHRLKDGQKLIDFVRIAHDRTSDGSYIGICW